VIQVDSLIMDKPATLEKLREIKKNHKSLIASVVNFILQNRVNLKLNPHAGFGESSCRLWCAKLVFLSHHYLTNLFFLGICLVNKPPKKWS
jgi:hypothetical protein